MSQRTQNFLALGIESVIHVEKKFELFQTLKRQGCSQLLLAEICGDGHSLTQEYPLFYPSLMYIQPQENYFDCLKSLSPQKIEFIEVGASVFVPWSDALNRIDEATFRGSKRVLRQFKQSYQDLSKEYARNSVSYLFLFVEF